MGILFHHILVGDSRRVYNFGPTLCLTMENLILEKPQDAQMVIVNDIFKIIRTKKDGTTSVKKQAIRNMDSDQKSGHLNQYGNIITEKSLFMPYIESKTDTIHEMIEGIETDDRYNR